MSLGDTVKKWAKDARAEQYKPVNAMERMSRKMHRTDRRLAEKKERLAKKMK